MRGFFFSPSLDGGFELVELSTPSRRRSSAFSARSAAFSRRSARVLAPKVLDLAPTGVDQLANLGGKNHPHLDSHFHPGCPAQSAPRRKNHANRDNSDSPT